MSGKHARFLSVHFLILLMVTVIHPVPQVLATSFEVTVEGSSLGPMPGLKVYAFTETGSYTGKHGVTDDNGIASLDPADFQNGAYKFRVDYLGNKFWSNVITLPEDSGVSVMIEEESVLVSVTTGQGPAEGVRVYLFSGTGSYLGKHQTTDPDGVVSFDLPVDRSFKFRADILGNRYFSDVATISGGGPNTVTVAAGGGLLGVILEKAPSSPMAGIKVYLFSDTGTYLGFRETTDASGNAVFSVPEGIYKVRADYLGYRFWSTETMVATDVDVLLTIPHQPVEITAQGVYQGASQPLEGIKTYLFSAAGSYQQQHQQTDPDGKATFQLPEKPYKVRADYMGERFWSEEFIWEDLTMSVPMAEAEVTVTGAGLPREGVKVYAFSTSGSYLQLFGTTDNQGKATFRLPEGVYRFRADYLGSRYWSPDSPLARDQVNFVNISTGGGAFTLTVLKAVDEPIAGVKCYVFSDLETYLGLSGATDADGEVSFDLADGAYIFRADYLGERFFSDVVVVPDVSGTGIMIEHETVLVTVQTAAGPLGGIKVYLFSENGLYLGDHKSTDENGSTSFALPVGKAFKFRADILGDRFWSDVVTVSGGGVSNIAIDAGGGLFQVTLQKAPGSPMAGIKVYLFSDTGTYLGLNETTDASGEAQFSVPQGVFKVRADYLGYRFWSEETLVTEDTQTVLTIPHQPVEITVQGFYQGAAEPLEGIKTYLFTSAGSYQKQHQQTDPNGKATFHLPQKAYKIRADHMAHRFWSGDFIWENVSLEIPMGEAEITVTQGGAGLPVEGVKVYAFSSTDSYLKVFDTTDNQGKVRFRLAQGSYKFRADKDGERYWSGTVDITADLVKPVAIVVPSSAPTISMTADPETIQPGGTSTLTWRSTDADSCCIDQGIGDVDLNGSMPVSPTETTTYAITATGPGGTAEAQVTVTIEGVFNEEKITAADAGANHSFGNSVSISGDYAAIGASGNDSAYVFTREGDSWTQEAKLTASDVSPGDGFGGSVSISGDHVVVGTWGNDSAYVFKRDGDVWTEQAKLTASDVSPGDGFGGSVSISGDYAVVGASGSNSAYVFKRDGDVWTQQAKLTVSDASEDACFGISVSISGEYLVAGTLIGDEFNAGAAYVFKRDGDDWVEQAKLTASDASIGDGLGFFVSMDGEYVIASAFADQGFGMGLGPVYVFKRDGDVWTEQAKLTAPDPSMGDNFGTSVSIKGEYAAVAAYDENDAGSFAGAVYIFTRVDDLWVEQAKRVASKTMENPFFMISTAIGDDCAILGFTGDDEYGDHSGAAFVYRFPTVHLTANPEIVPTAGDPSTLSWSSTHVESVVIDNGIGEVPLNGSLTVTPTETTGYTITATGALGTTMAGVTVTVGYPPEVDINGNPVSIQIGESATLTWNSSNADSVSIDQGIGDVDPNGSISVSPTETTTYTITAVGPGGTVTDRVTITVTIPQVTVELNSDPQSIQIGESATLTWNSSNADSVSIDQGIGTVDLNGSMTVSPTETTTYTITASSPGGTVTDSVTITVTIPQVTVALSADPQYIQFGESSTLSWSSGNADSLSIDQGIGTVGLNGSMTVSPTETTTYTITASSPGGTVTDSVTITVTIPQVTVALSADPQSIQLGESATLSWTSTNADSLSIDQGIGTVDLNGSMTVSPTETTTYTITAEGPGGTAQADVTVTVINAQYAPVVSMSADPATIPKGSSTLLSWTSSHASGAHIDNGIGVVPGNGSVSISPQHTTTYTITATGPGGSANQNVTVLVTGDPESQPEGSFGQQYEDLTPMDATIEEYDPKRFSVVTGLVVSIDDSAVSGVSVTVHDHPEYGTALTDADGRFSIPVEGGSNITLRYHREGLIPSQRQVYVPWNGIAVCETLQMIAEDPETTTFTLDGDSGTVVTHRSTEVTDEFGSRACSMIFTGDNRAYLMDEDGNDVQELTTITTRATEFATPESMPAVLPPNVAYTYCVELTVEGADRVRFEKPVTTWINNFLGFEVGMAVPVGYYDRDRGVWVPSDNGVVVKLLDTDGDGIVDAMDSDGDDLPDDLNSNESFRDEIAGLEDPFSYPPDTTFWRVEVTHFTPWDFNWLYGPEPGAEPPGGDDFGEPHVDEQKPDSCDLSTGSFVEKRSRIFHEDVPIPGTNMTLHYASNRVEGYETLIKFPISRKMPRVIPKRIVVEVEIAGNTFKQTFDSQADLEGMVLWDGLDYLGRPVSTTKAMVDVGYVYDSIYYEGMIFGGPGVDATKVFSRQEATLWKHTDLKVHRTTAADGFVSDGWTISKRHYLEPSDITILYKGDGTIEKNSGWIIETIAGTGEYGFSGDEGPAIEATFFQPRGVAVDSAGNLYIADYLNHRIRKVDVNGVITTVAGSEGSGFSGDGGPAVDATLSSPYGVAVDPARNLYIADTGNLRVRKVDPSGVITTVAGNGMPVSGGDGGPSIIERGDGGPAVDANLSGPCGVAVDSAGNIYIGDYQDHCVRKVDPSGVITTVAGNGEEGFSGDGGLASEAKLNRPYGVGVDSADNLYIADYENFRVRRVDPSGIITTIAGTGEEGFSGDGGSATEAKITWPHGVAVDSAGNLYIADTLNYCVRKVDPSGLITTVVGTGESGYGGDGGPASVAMLNQPYGVAVDSSGNLYVADKNNNRIRKAGNIASFTDATSAGDITFAEESGLGYIMSSAGRHKKTIDLDTGITLYDFAYDADDRLISITDRFGNRTTVDRDANGVPVSITSPRGLITDLTIDTNNQLTGITHPDGNEYSFEYTAGDLMTAKTEPEGNRFEHVFNDSGRLTDAVDQEGGHWVFSRLTDTNGDILSSVTSGEGNVTAYLDNTDSTGKYTSIITDPTGGETLFTRSSEGLTANKSLPCGMNLAFQYGIDPEYKFKVVREMWESAPSGLEKVTLFDKTYEDTDGDAVPDRITRTVTENGRTTTIVNHVLESRKTVTSPEGRIVNTLYDPDTLLTEKITIPGSYDTTYAYNSEGKLRSMDINARGTTFAYNDKGFLDSVTDPRNHTTSYVYDPVGRVTGINRPDGSSVGFTYDKNGNMTVLRVPIAVDHGFGYNKVNRENAYHAPLSGTYQYAYDKDRRLISTVFPSGREINNIYDKTRLVRIETPEGNIDQTYLCATKVGSVSNGSDAITYGYDGKLVTSETLSGTLNQTLSYTYDNNFNPATFTYAGGSESYAYDQDGLLTGAGNYTITRNAQNGLPEGVNGGALSISRTHNGYGEIETESHSVNNQPLAAWDLTRNENGGITEKAETVDGTASSYAYTYDPTGRLLTVRKDGVLVQEYTYDPNGVRIYEMNAQRGIAGRNFSYSDEDHLLSAGETTYLYDYDGFLSIKTNGSGVTEFDYSIRGELKSVSLPSGTIIEYVHDPLGRRIAKKMNGTVVEKYLWQGLTRLLGVYDSTNNLLMRFEYADGRMPVAVTRSDGTYYLIYDQVGSLKVVADASGNVVKRIEYDPFGNILTDTDPAFEIPFGFAGGLYDRDTGLVRFGYRDYDPDVGRWTAKDPIRFSGGDTDLYGYCLNDPVNWFDPEGLQGYGWRPGQSWDPIPSERLRGCDEELNYHRKMTKHYSNKIEKLQLQRELMQAIPPNETSLPLSLYLLLLDNLLRLEQMRYDELQKAHSKKTRSLPCR